MDFSNQGQQGHQAHGRAPAPGPNTSRFTPIDVHRPHQPTELEKPKKQKRETEGRTLWIRIVLVVFLLCLVALIVALLLVIGMNKQTNESKYVDTSTYQAVEVANTDSRTPTYYYGKITSVSDSYIVLAGASVLTSNPSDQTVSVEPLSCVASKAGNGVILDKSQVVMWNNVDSSSSVAQALKQLAQNTGSCPANNSTAPTKKSTDTDTTKKATTNTDKNSAGSQSSSTTNTTTTTP